MPGPEGRRSDQEGEDTRHVPDSGWEPLAGKEGARGEDRPSRAPGGFFHGHLQLSHWNCTAQETWILQSFLQCAL